MTPGYLTSDFQAYVLDVIRNSDRAHREFFVRPPFVIDCTGDRARFEAEVDEAARKLVIEHTDAGTRPTGAWPRQPVADYIQRQASAKARELDAETVALVRAFIEGWQSETGRQTGQLGKAELSATISPVEIILPIPGVRFPVALWGLPGT